MKKNGTNENEPKQKKGSKKQKGGKASKFNKPSRVRYRTERRREVNKLKRILRASGLKEAQRWSSQFGVENILYHLTRTHENKPRQIVHVALQTA